MTRISEQVEWLNLIDRSGPFVVPAVLDEVFPQGIEKVETPRRQRLRSAYDEWRDAVDEGDPQIDELHAEWIRLVLQEALEFEDGVLIARADLGGQVIYRPREHSMKVEPDFAIRGSSGGFRLLIAVYPPNTDLEKSVPDEAWSASPIERMTLLCRANEVRLGLVTNGEEWLLVNAPIGGTSGYASWFARLWWQEPVTLKAFISLLGVRRCFGPSEATLEQLLERSLAFQEEVTDTLGEQVRRAVEVLIQALGRADQDRNGELLKDVPPSELYEAGLTVMMRLVFILCAEERKLLLLGDPVYDEYYAISTLRARLREDESDHGPEVLERRHDAWSRMLSVFRAVYGGVEHEALRMPALGGSLFDPDRFPFLEGRARGTSWREVPSAPLPIDNRTVLLLLTALQVLEQRGGAQLLSYRALDVEQIGHVYEGLLEYTVSKLSEVTVGLIGSQKVRHPTIGLTELESLRNQGMKATSERLADLTGRARSSIENTLERGGDDAAFLDLLHVCGGAETIARRLRPFAGLIRADSWGALLVYQAGSFAITRGADRRETGTHYTPRSLAEMIVEKTLEPIVYIGPSEGAPREEWQLRTPGALLNLKICDPAMGSGAFLVQVCHYLAERLLEAWSREETAGRVVTVDGVVRASLGDREPLPGDLDERLLIARRLIAERCLYGVDLNPLAVELAKLSIWLVTLAKGRPFGFLDHNLRCGDSLLGIHRLDQLTELDMHPGSTTRQAMLFGRSIKAAVDQAINLRNCLVETPIRDVGDVQAMTSLDVESRRALKNPFLVADALVGEALRSASDGRALATALYALAPDVDHIMIGSPNAVSRIRQQATAALMTDLPIDKSARRPFHWPLVFPEVFQRENGGFDAIVGNPPFLGGQRITRILGTAYRQFLVRWLACGTSGSADLVAYFFLRAFDLLRPQGAFGLLAINTISEGDTRRVGLERLIGELGAAVYAAYPNEPWPGKAAVAISRVHIYKGTWKATATLGRRSVSFISAFLTDQEEWTPKPLRANAGRSFQGSIVLGLGFTLGGEEASAMIARDRKNRDVILPYINGKDLNSDPEQRPSRWVITFWDWPEEKAQEYEEPYRIVRELVRPERQRQGPDGKYQLRKPLPHRWWQYAEKRPGLYHAIGRGHPFMNHPDGWNPDTRPMDRVLVCSEVTKHLAFCLIPNVYIMSANVDVFPEDDPGFFAVVQSSIHEVWARKLSSKLETRLKYSPGNAFETFPFPLTHSSPLLRKRGQEYLALRADIMRANNIGLTQLYNMFHDQGCTAPLLHALRTLHKEIDLAVALAYEWHDLDLEHAFHRVPDLPEGDQVRYTISETARRDILTRLSRLNRERFTEVNAG